MNGRVGLVRSVCAPKSTAVRISIAGLHSKERELVMTFQSLRRTLMCVPVPALKKSRRCASRTRHNDHQPSFERLEDRTLLSSYGLGSAFALGSSGIENANAVATDAAGDVLVAGMFDSASLDLDPGPGAYVLSNAGGYDGYAAKYDSAGNLAWGVQVRGAGNGSVFKVA